MLHCGSVNPAQYHRKKRTHSHFNKFLQLNVIVNSSLVAVGLHDITKYNQCVCENHVDCHLFK